MSKTAMQTQEQELYEAKWTADSRKAHKANGGYFAGPDDSFPLKDASDVSDAWGLAGHADNPDAVRRNIINWAKQHGHTDALPDTAKEFMVGGKSEESAAITTGWRPQKKIATIRVCYLEYNARSLNGRIYPKATCDAIHASMMRKLADPGALPMTCFVSHEAANGNVNTQLVGMISGGSQEGGKFYASIDIADTSVARDQLGLIEGKYMRSESMRVQGVELQHDPKYDLPLVVPQEGYEPEMMGIDLTTRPGLIDSARILQTLYEGTAQPPYTESFTIEGVSIQSKEEAAMPIPLYLQVIAEMHEGVTADRAAHSRVHDHLAGVLDETIKAVHGEQSESLRKAAALSEEGRAIAQKHAKRLAAAHDESAKQLGMDCEGAYNEALGIALDPDQDGTDDQGSDDQPNDGESANTKGEKVMTEEEMLAALKAKGYSVEAPKTAEEKIAALEAKLEEQDRKLVALSESQSMPTSRQTQALGSANEGGELQPEPIYQEGDYLAGTLKPANWKALADPRVPWPHDKLDPKLVVQEMAPFLAYRLNAQEAASHGRDISAYIGQHEQL